MKDFKQSQAVKQIGFLDFSSEILTSGHWPYQDAPKFSIPPQLENAKRAFTDYYKSKFANREILWLFNHGNC